MRALFLTISLFVLCHLSRSVFAATFQTSFDCQKAKTEVEKAICHDSNFAQWDVILSETFKEKKGNASFKTEYLKWLELRNSCKGQWIEGCLREKYAIIFGQLYTKYNGPTRPIIPHFQCFRPLLPMANGDQGFYAMRVISSIRGCHNLNLNLEGLDPKEKFEVSFLEKKDAIYFYSFKETFENEVHIYRIGVTFELQEIMDSNLKKREPTLVMSLRETSGG